MIRHNRCLPMYLLINLHILCKILFIVSRIKNSCLSNMCVHANDNSAAGITGNVSSIVKGSAVSFYFTLY